MGLGGGWGSWNIPPRGFRWEEVWLIVHVNLAMDELHFTPNQSGLYD